MSYPGGKSGAGVYQRLINEIPPHSIYVAGFAGHDAIARYKRPAARNILIDLDPEPLDWWAKYLRSQDGESVDDAGWELHNCSGVEWLRYQFGLTQVLGVESGDPAATSNRSTSAAELLGAPDPATVDRASRYRDWFVFLDPPYVMSSRSGGPMYRHEMTDAEHAELLRVVRMLPCKVMLCGYWSEIYAKALHDWRVVEYTSVARSGEKRTEYAWCNYRTPSELHDTRFVGGDKREREKIRRRIKRLSSNLGQLAPHERQAVIDAVRRIQPTDLATTPGES